MGVNRPVINLGTDPTYENSRVALNDFRECTVVPMRRRHSVTLSSQLLPLFEANGKISEIDDINSEEYEKKHDFSKRRVYCKRRGGHLSLSGMHEVTGTEEQITNQLKQLINATEDHLPEKPRLIKIGKRTNYPHSWRLNLGFGVMNSLIESAPLL